MNGLEAAVGEIAHIIQVIFEASSILIVAAGGIVFAYETVARRSGTLAGGPKQTLSRYLILALELQLAADIIATATDPSLLELGKLGAIAAIRTFLNYFLFLEMREEKAA